MAPQPEIGGDFPETSTASSGITTCHVWLPEGNRSSTIQNDDSIGVEWDINGIDDIIYIYTHGDLAIQKGDEKRYFMEK